MSVEGKGLRPQGVASWPTRYHKAGTMGDGAVRQAAQGRQRPVSRDRHDLWDVDRKVPATAATSLPIGELPQPKSTR